MPLIVSRVLRVTCFIWLFALLPATSYASEVLIEDDDGFNALDRAISHGRLGELRDLLEDLSASDLAAEAGLFGDPRVKYWSYLYWADEKADLLELLEADLLSENAHPFSGYIWSVIHSRQGMLETEIEKASPELKAKLGLDPAIEMLWYDEQSDVTLEQYGGLTEFGENDFFVLVRLAQAAQDTEQYPLAKQFLEFGLKLFPDSWQFVWMYETRMHDSPALYEMGKALAADPSLQGTLAGAYLAELASRRNWGSHDRLEIQLRDWINERQSDARLQTSVALNYASNWRYEPALRHMFRGVIRFPFYSNAQTPMFYLSRMGKEKQAIDYSQLVGRWYESSPEKIETKALDRLIPQFVTEGNKGIAREMMQEALAKYPNDRYLAETMAELERGDKRWAEAASWAAKALRGRDRSHNHIFDVQLEALGEDGDHLRIVELYRQALGTDQFLFLEIHVKALDALRTLKRWSELDEQIEIVLAQFPGSKAVARHKAESLWRRKQTRQAFELVDQLIQAHPRDRSLLKLGIQYAEESYSSKFVEDWLAKKVEAAPWNATLAEEQLAFSQPNASLEEKIQFWQAVQNNNRDLFLGCGREVLALTGARQYPAAWDRAVACEEATFAGTTSPTERLSSARYKIYVLEQWSKRRYLDYDFVVAAASQWHEVANQYSESLSNFYRYEEQICQAKQDKNCAAEALYQRSLLVRSNTGVFHDLVAKYRNELNDDQTLGYGARMLDRNPYNVSVVNSFLHKHTLWAGSPIVALKAHSEAEARGLSPRSNYKRDALGKLGDPYSKFKGYFEGRSPSDSLRYVNWFHSARQDALYGEAKQIRYLFDDGDHPGIEVVLPNGEIAVRRDHAVFGKIAYLGKGAGFVKFDYTPEGLLSSIEDSSGKQVNLDYNERGEIDRFEAANGRVLLFQYNENSQPVVIEIEGQGSIKIEYGPDGSTTKVESDQGPEMSLQVSQAFQELMALVSYAKQADQLDGLPSFNFVDVELDALREDLNTTRPGSSRYRNAEEALAAYLVEHIKDSNDYFWEATNLLTNMIEYGKVEPGKKAKHRAIRAIELWHQLYQTVKPHGLPEYEFSDWSDMRNWLVAYGIQSGDKVANRALAKIDASPITLLRDAHWLSRSNMSNSGFWKRSGDHDLVVSKRQQNSKQAVLIRDNGDVVVGTNRGLSVRREGHWQWFGFDDATGRFSHNMSPSQITETSDVLALAETRDGRLWVGTARGLFAVNDYLADVQRWRTKQDGLPSPRIEALASRGDQIFIGTARGMVTASETGELVGLNHAESLQVSTLINVRYTASPVLLVKTGLTLELVTEDGRTTVTEDARLFTYGQELGTVYWLDSQGLIFARDLIENDGSMVLRDELPRVLARPTDLLMSKQIHELQVWPIPEYGESMVVNSDIAVNVLRNNYFQAMPLPYEVARGGMDLGPRISTSLNNDIVALTDEGVYRFAPSEVTQIMDESIYDILTDDELGVTYVATGFSLRYLDHDEPGYLSWVNNASARHLQQDKAGNLITHDGYTVLKFPRGDVQPIELFDAEASPTEEGWQGMVNDLLVDSNDVIWVASGSSVFRYDGENLQEFNYLLDREAFPSRSSMIFSLYEDASGDVYAVASDEGHLSHQGVDLSGGALRWTGSGFENLGQDPHWFAHSYTKINDDLAIVGTSEAIAREKGGVRESYESLKDVTFEEMSKASKMLWLVGDGAKMGDSNSWLFPTAGGVAVYHEGQWFYPDRLNQLLPNDQALGQYGARTVHAVSVDKNGTVYVGTDLGLLVYRADGIESLLTDNYRGQMAFSNQEVQKHRELTDVFLGAIDPKSDQGKMLNRFQRLDQVISRTQSEIDSLETDVAGAGADPEERNQASLPDQLKKKLRENERNRQRLLARMEKEEPGLFQMLRFDPREASAMNEKLADNQVLIQFLPTRKTLQIQVVTNEGAVIRQVEVERDELMNKSLYAAAALRDGVLDLYDFKATRGSGSATFDDVEDLDIDISWEVTRERLTWLYDKMFRPIERDLEGKEQVFVTSVGSLTYLPFGALIRNNADENIEYAVQRFNIGVLPSLFHYGLVVDYEESYASDVLFIADPDGSLPGARQEVQSISDQMYDSTVILEGEQATMTAVDERAPEARIVHFATHGVLDEDSPADSYLLLADNRRLSAVDISTMDLSQTDIVVLSACESGVGSSGLEYATLARAFAHAKVPSVLASYWEVHDEATRQLMTNFYGVLQESDDVDYFSALSQAQRAMIAAGGKGSHPSAWSGFSIFGKP